MNVAPSGSLRKLSHVSIGPELDLQIASFRFDPSQAACLADRMESKDAQDVLRLSKRMATLEPGATLLDKEDLLEAQDLTSGSLAQLLAQDAS